ncbi:uncharacterized protein LOC6616753 [Drosophila sechellia]|uniref:GM15232 n=1 Tax=Drosophila sechellia TaxID=7238 RepID=B4IBI0_DROSE|nr:uncharacterized protein LOC6616753 [Drosophila sechellia]EDW44738.1 GM15232 [Drosophila sechellia]
MAARSFVIFSAIFVLAQGSNFLPIEQEAEVPIHSGAPAEIISQGHPSVSQSVGSAYGQGTLQVPVGGGHSGVGLGLAGARPYVAAPPPAVSYTRPAVSYARPAVSAPRPAVSYARPAAVVVPALVVAPIRQPQGVPAPAVVGAGHGNVYHGRHHG